MRRYGSQDAGEAQEVGDGPDGRLPPGSPHAPCPGPAPVDRPTPQELQVARAVGEGLSNGEAATSQFLPREAVEAHLTRVYRKSGVRSRTDPARRPARAGRAGGRRAAGGRGMCGGRSVPYPRTRGRHAMPRTSTPGRRWCSEGARGRSRPR
ncbi:response regulator transcription factor [Streptomyces fructofermentans]|uniref:response regulator transcription factor n=1 Tax=Streptomyces fructofermentans TaxID=152141 RepID=UPI0037A07E88